MLTSLLFSPRPRLKPSPRSTPTTNTNCKVIEQEKGLLESQGNIRSNLSTYVVKGGGTEYELSFRQV